MCLYRKHWLTQIRFPAALVAEVTLWMIGQSDTLEFLDLNKSILEVLFLRLTETRIQQYEHSHYQGELIASSVDDQRDQWIESELHECLRGENGSHLAILRVKRRIPLS